MQLTRVLFNRLSHNLMPRVAVLYQALEPPIVNGVRKPMKQGGYQDSGADIAYALQKAGVAVATPHPNPNPTLDSDWCFPDTEAGILEAVHIHRATHLWANTILFSSHPLQTSTALDSLANTLKIVGQPPNLVQHYDDKNFVNNLLRENGSFDLPKSWLVHTTKDDILSEIPYPIVAKPIRGRGSHGVRLCKDRAELTGHLQILLQESSPAMLEEYLAGEEATVTVMPPTPSSSSNSYRALPLILRTDHINNILPPNTTVAITYNSHPLPSYITTHPTFDTTTYAQILRSCERIASLLRLTAPIRIDVRRHHLSSFSSSSSNPDSESENDDKFAVFDVNMKPNMTGPGRPGRDNQASLTGLAAAEVGWDYARLLSDILASARSLGELRGMRL